MGRIPQDVIDRVLSATDIVDLVGTYVPLKPRGANHIGLCPFHREKTPSFSVHRERQIFKCFGCGKGGTAISFLQEVENLTFIEAVQTLADRAGIEIPKTEEWKPKNAPEVDRYDVMAWAAKQYKEWLEKSPRALDYLKNRGLEKKHIDHFQLGLAPDSWSSLTDALQKQKIPMKVAEELGLTVPQNSGQGYYDRFRNRIIFPIKNNLSRIIAFGGRALGDDGAKYLNSPETPLFSKSRTLYLLDKAREACKAEGMILVVEGYMDAISLHVAGFRNTVATLGTAITEEHVRVLQRYTDHVALMYDGDTAGMNAAQKGVASFLATGRPVDVVLLPEGEDPDSYVQKNGSEGMSKLVEGAEDGFEILIRQSIANHGIHGAAAKRAISAELLPILSSIPVRVVQHEYLEMLASRLSMPREVLEEDMKKHHAPRPTAAQAENQKRKPPVRVPQTRNALNSDEQLIADVICLVLHDIGALAPEKSTGTDLLDEPETGFLTSEQRKHWRERATQLIGAENPLCLLLEWALDSRPGKPFSSHLQRLEEESAEVIPLACDLVERWPIPSSGLKAAKEIDARILQVIEKKEFEEFKASRPGNPDRIDHEFLKKVELAQASKRHAS